jgi:hypothetical protein
MPRINVAIDLDTEEISSDGSVLSQHLVELLFVPDIKCTL